MFKAFIILLVTMQFGFARDLVMTHERFVHLTEQEKDSFVIQVMEMMVELEAKHYHAAAVHGPDSNEARKYSLLLKQLNSLFISSAYAADERVSITSFGEDFASLISSGKSSDRCFYAGWISRVTTVTSKDKSGKSFQETICIHPARLPKDAPEHKAYSKGQNCPLPNPKSSVKDQISCNPAIFNFDKATTQFCVPAGINNSYNSSYSCMQKALGDGKQERLEALKKQLQGNPKLVTSLNDFVVKTCLCNENANPVASAEYLKSVRPHRTCYSMLKMMTETSQCGDVTEQFNLDIFKKIKDYASQIEAKKDSSFDDAYASFIQQVRQDHKQDYEALCKDKAGAKKSPSCVVKCKGKDCKFNVLDENKKEIPFTKPQGPFTPGKTFKITLENKEQVDCQVQEEKTPGLIVAPVGPQPSPAPNGTTPAPVITTPPPSNTTTTPGPTTPGPTTDPTTTTPAADTKKTEPASECPTHDGAITCEVETEDKGEKGEARLKITPDKDFCGLAITWYPGGGSEKVISYDKDDETPTASIAVSVNNKLETIQCTSKGGKPDDESKSSGADGDKPEFKLEVEKTTATERTFKIVVTKEVDGWEPVWVVETKEKKKAETGIAVKGESTEEGDASSDKDEKEDKDDKKKKKAEKEETTKVEVGNETSYTADREAKDYNVCVSLKKDSESTKELCMKVPQKEVKPPKSTKVNTPIPPMTPPAPYVRPTRNYSIQGVQ